jgi:uncharacterized membrane protein YhaH (DUF805 family)
MGLGHYLFGFSGRINRAKQWAMLLVSLVGCILIGVAFAFTIGGGPIVDAINHKTTFAAIVASPQAHLFGIAFGVVDVLMIYISLAVMAKRLHDRNKSAWWILIFFVLPLALQVPVFMAMPALFAHLGAVMHAAQNHLPPPPQPFESPVVLIARGAAAIINLWAFVELYILRGTAGDNRFGPDPLAGRG